MLRRNNKKGFTLAELLIVVAIIAVLVAIAVPLFVSALNKAQKATEDANKRAVRGAAVVAILNADLPSTPASSSATDDIYTATTNDSTTYTWELKGPWYATATINANGDIETIVVNLTVVAESYTKSGDTITCIVKINKTDLTTTA